MRIHTFGRLSGRVIKVMQRAGQFSIAATLLLMNIFAWTPGHAAASTFTQPCGNPGTPGKVQHVVWIWMENESFNDVIGSPNAPYQTSLAHQCGTATSFANESHGSLDNYIAATDGQQVPYTSFTADCLPNPTGKFCVSGNQNIFSQTQAAGGSWRNYAEDSPANCYQSDSGNYAARHVPAVYYTNLASCNQYAVAMGDAGTQTGQFYSDLSSGSLPNFSFISPNLNDDAHSSDTATGDVWLSKLIPTITASPNYQAGNTVIFVTNDEGGGSDYAINEDCTDQTQFASRPSCHIPTTVIAPYIPSGTTDNTFYTHYSMLRTTEELLGLPLLGQAASANSMAANFNLGPISNDFSLPSTPTNLSATTTSSSKVTLNWNAATPGTVPLSGYNIIRNGSVIATTSGAAPTYTDTSANAGATYTYNVAAVDTVGNVSGASNTASTSTPAATNVLTNPGFEQWSSGSPTGWATYGSATTFTQSSDVHSGASSVKVATNVTGYTSAGLYNNGIKSTTAGASYTGSCWVKASQAIPVSVQLKEAGQTAATNVVTVPTTNNWYQIQMSDVAVKSGDAMSFSAFSSSMKAGGATLQFDDCFLAADTYPSTGTQTPPPAPVAPSAPTNLAAAATSTTQVNLSWSAAVAGSSPIASYQIWRNGVQIATTSGTSYGDTTVAPGTNYSYYVVAVDGNGLTSPNSNTATATTPTVLNLLTNGGFEQWSSGAPTGWTAYGAPNTVFTQSTSAHGGNYSVNVSTKASGYYASGLNDGSTPTINSTVAGTTYTASCWVKATKSIAINVQLAERQHNYALITPIVTTTYTVPTTTGWYFMQVSDKATTSGNMMPFSVFSTATSGGGASFYVDDCSITTSS